MAESRRALPNLLGWAGPETVCRCLEQAVRRGPKRTGARTFAQIRAVWERPSFRVGLAADWVRLLRSLPRRPDRCATPTGVRAGPISGGSSAHLSSYVDTACIQRCQTTDVRASSTGNRADVGAIRWRAGAIEYYPGRKDRQTAPRRLVRLERKSWLPDARPSRATSDPGRLFGVRQFIGALVRPASAARPRTAHLSLRFPHRPKRR